MCLEGALPREGLRTFTCLTLTPLSGQSNHWSWWSNHVSGQSNPLSGQSNHSSGQSNHWIWWWLSQCSVTMILLSWEGEEVFIHFNPIDGIIITVITSTIIFMVIPMVMFRLPESPMEGRGGAAFAAVGAFPRFPILCLILSQCCHYWSYLFAIIYHHYISCCRTHVLSRTVLLHDS